MPWRRWLPLLLVVVLGGCSSVPFARPRLVPTRELTVNELLAPFWLDGDDVYRMRQTGLFRYGKEELPLEGFMELNAAGRQARLLIFDGMGLKLLDLTVSAEGVEEHYLHPELRQQPYLAEAVGASVRRIFLRPQPAPDNVLEIEGRCYRLRPANGTGLSFIFGGEPPLLLEKHSVGPTEHWQVSYYQYRQLAGRLIPEAGGGAGALRPGRDRGGDGRVPAAAASGTGQVFPPGAARTDPAGVLPKTPARRGVPLGGPAGAGGRTGRGFQNGFG
ncbi:MAG: hypothetical protein P8X63_10395 [Desulfuromonadaceae bacterium]